MAIQQPARRYKTEVLNDVYCEFNMLRVAISLAQQNKESEFMEIFNNKNYLSVIVRAIRRMQNLCKIKKSIYMFFINEKHLISSYDIIRSFIIKCGITAEFRLIDKMME